VLPTAQFFRQVRGAFYVGLGLLSFQAMGVVLESHWRLYAHIFAFIAGVAMAVCALFWTPGMHNALALLPIVPFFAVFPGNRALCRKHRGPTGEEFGRGADGWTMIDLPTGPLLAIQGFLYGRRSTHLMGVAARGTFRVVPEERAKFP